jgi:hypothetical protein
MYIRDANNRLVPKKQNTAPRAHSGFLRKALEPISPNKLSVRRRHRLQFSFLKTDDVASGSGNDLVDSRASVGIVQTADIPTQNVEKGA